MKDMFRIALARAPTEKEMSICLEVLSSQAAHYREKEGKNENEAGHLALRDLCYVVLNMNEFIYVP